MKSRPSRTLALLLALGLLAPALAQQQPPPPPQRAASSEGPPQQPQQTAPADDSDVVRISTNLVQLDVVVTDGSGRPVTDLTPADFEVREEGRPQPLTNFAYVPAEAPAARGEAGAPAPAPRPAVRRGVPPAVVAPLRREQVRRTIVFVTHNLRMSFGSVGRVREGLRKFVDERMQPGDLVGVYGTRGGSSALQQFTSDRVQLHRAIDAVRWYPPTRGDGTGIDPFEAERDDSTYKTVRAGSGEAPRGRQTFEDDRSRATREALADRAADLQAYDALGTLHYVLEGLRGAPGRKVVVFFSDGLPLFSRRGERGQAADRLNRAIDLANRAGAVVYTVDARGVFIPALGNPRLMTAESSGQPSWPGGPDMSRSAPRDDDALDALAHATGGLFIRSMNFMDKALDRVLLDQSGYYLLGYRPSEETFKGGRASFRDISVRVRRPGLNVRHRKGFLAVTDEALERERGSRSRLYSVLASPVNAGEVYVRMTVSFAEAAAGAGVARLFLHIDGRDVTFADDPDGWKKLVLDVAAVTLGREGEIADEFTRTHTVRAGGDTLRRIRENGLTYAADVPVKKPGTYQLRIVVRDQATQRVGSASQFLEVPNLSKKKLAMSGITLGGAPPLAPGAGAPSSAETALSPVMSPADQAVRKFTPGAIISYGYQVYNAALDPATRRPRLSARIRLYHNGELAAEGQPVALDAGDRPDPSRVRVEDSLRIVANAAPGEYVLHIVVTDEAAGGLPRASQWVDFEVVR